MSKKICLKYNNFDKLLLNLKKGWERGSRLLKKKGCFWSRVKLNVNNKETVDLRIISLCLKYVCCTLSTKSRVIAKIYIVHKMMSFKKGCSSVRHWKRWCCGQGMKDNKYKTYSRSLKNFGIRISLQPKRIKHCPNSD